MSMLSQKRKRWEYQSQAPRCEICHNYRRPGLFLRDSLPVKSPPMCKSGEFIVTAHAICKHFQVKSKP